MELRHGSLQSSQKSRLTALPGLPRACPRHHIGGQAAEAGGGARVRPGQTRPPGGTAAGTTRDSRRGAATAATALPGLPGVLFFWGRGCGRLVAGVAGRLLLPLCAGELGGSAGKSSRWHTTAKPQPGQPAAHGPEGRRGPAQRLPPASWPRRKKWETPPLAAKAPDETARQAVRDARHQPPGPRHHDHGHHGS